MPTVRRIMNHVEAEVAQGQRRCKRDKRHVIQKGEACLTIQDIGTPFRKSYCRICALAILKQCGSELRVIRDMLYPNDSSFQPQANPIKTPIKRASPQFALVRQK